jgi:hypothetical protein
VARQKVPKLFSGPSVFTIQKFNFVKGYYIRQRGKVLEVRYLKITLKQEIVQVERESMSRI